MINFSALAAAVINQAYDDAMKEIPPSEYRGKPANWVRERKESQEFLSEVNEDLDFWCQIGGLNAPAIVNACKGKFKPVEVPPPPPLPVCRYCGKTKSSSNYCKTCHKR